MQDYYSLDQLKNNEHFHEFFSQVVAAIDDGCHYLGIMALQMRKILLRPLVGVRVCHLLLLSF